ncbi:DUF3102 domain-containing protein [Methylobacterium sp. GC_Met_2]|uniref:DUF3102 domain-containing protein n=1 Tax=Methylobacterium sp. GC_Met_2 TaxID=2937376 RepID=UPI00226B9B3D|nr:DUF3102 domain-containing protein [Methylobacterium sp. GC_Met_2]
MSNRLPVLVGEIRRAHEEARSAARFSAERALAAGHLLIEAKTAVGHGEWLPWLRANLGMSERTAQGYMRLARTGLKSATVADLGLRATLTRVGRRKAPDLSLPAGRLIRLVAGEKIQAPMGQPAELCHADSTREHDIFLWSPDGEAALKLHYYFDPDGGEACWGTSAWKRPVDVNKVPLVLIAEGFPLRQATISSVIDFKGTTKINMQHNLIVNLISLTLYGDNENLWPKEARDAYLNRWFNLPTEDLPRFEHV